MNDPIRFLSDPDAVDEQELFRSAKPDGPSAASKRRAAIALGIGGLTVAATVGGVAATNVGGAAAAPGASQGVLTAARALALKWLGIGIAVGTVGTSAAYTARERYVANATAQARVVPSQAPAPTRPDETAVKLVDVVPDAAQTPREQEAALMGGPPSAARALSPPSGSPSSSLRVQPSPVAASPPRADSSMHEELVLLERARAALRVDDAETAARILDGYNRRFPKGELHIEAAVLEIDALSVAHNDSATLARADRFLAAYPNEPQSRHVRDIAERLRAAQASPKSP